MLIIGYRFAISHDDFDARTNLKSTDFVAPHDKESGREGGGLKEKEGKNSLTEM